MERALNEFDSYSQWLRIPADRRPPKHYELLGLALGEPDVARIRAASIERTAYVRRFCLGPHGAEANHLLSELGEAFACLSDPAAKADYDRRLGIAKSGSVVAPPPTSPALQPSHGKKAPRRSWANRSKKIAAPARSSPRAKRTVRSFVPARFAPGRFAPGRFAPGRFALAAACVLGATCGVVWSALRLPREDDPVAPVASRSVAAADRQTPSATKPATRSEQRKPRVAPPASRPIAPKPAAAKDVTPPEAPKESSRDDKSAGESVANPPARPDAVATNPGGPLVDLPDADMPAAPGAAPDQPAPQTQPMEDRSRPAAAPRQPDIVKKSEMAPFSVGHLVDTVDVDFAKPDADIGKVWRSATRGRPETLELSFIEPVSAAFVRIFETPLSVADVERVVVYPESGPPVQIMPIQISFSDEQRARTWSLKGARSPAKRVDVTFRPTREGFVEANAVVVLDRNQHAYYPLSALATSSAAPGDPDIITEEDALADEHPAPKPRDALEEFDEVAAQTQLDKARKQPTVGAFAAVLRDHPKSDAAVEAVRELAEIIASMPNSGEVTTARRALVRLVTHFPDTEAAKIVSAALREAESGGPRPRPGANNDPSGPAPPVWPPRVRWPRTR